MTDSDNREELAATTVDPSLEAWQGFIVEIWLTWILVQTIFGATNLRRKKVFMAGIPIGMAVALDVMAGVKALESK